MAQVNVTTDATTILDGTETVDSLVRVGSFPIRIATGDPASRSFANATPMSPGQVVIFPAGVEVTAWVGSGSAPVWVETFG